MDDDRREFLIGLGSALVTGFGCYTGYRSIRAADSVPPLEPVPRPAPEPESFARSPGYRGEVELPQVHAELGRTLEPGSASQALAFDRRVPFGRVRPVLQAMGALTVELLVEVHSRHNDPHMAGLPILLDVDPEPGMKAQDAAARAALMANEVMPLPWTYTGITVNPDSIRIDHGGAYQVLDVPATADASEGWASPMWTLAQRAGVSRLHGRRPWLFASDETPWGLVVRVIEACAPPPCQPHNDAKDRCTWRWASLYVGEPV